MKIRIKEFRGVPVCRGFFPRAGLRMKAGDVYECQDDKEYKRCMDTDLVEVVVDDVPVTERLIDRMEVLNERDSLHADIVKPKRGRPRKDAVEAG